MIDTYLVPDKTTVTAKGDGETLDVSAATNRIFLATLNVTDVVEQESIEVSIFGSADGTTWGAKAIANLPQQFYRGPTPMLIDLREQPEVKFLRAHWEVNRWGRGPETPRFELGMTLKEVPPEVLEEARAEAKTRL